MESRKANHAVPSWPRSTLNQIKWKIIFRKTTSHNSDASQSRGGGQQNWFWGYKSLRQGDGLLFLQEGLPTKPLLQQHIEICPHTHGTNWTFQPPAWGFEHVVQISWSVSMNDGVSSPPSVFTVSVRTMQQHIHVQLQVFQLSVFL